MSDPSDAAELRAALEALADGARELERRARDAARATERLAGPAAAPDGGSRTAGDAAAAAPVPGSDPRAGALLVALTLRGGTLPRAELEALAAVFGVSSGELTQLLAGAEAPLTARRGGTVGLTERGVEEAAAWRDALPPELLRAATTL